MRFSRRQLRGLAIIAMGGQVRRITDKLFEVRSQSRDVCYKVKWGRKSWSCQCEDFKAGRKCKHIWAVLYVKNLPNLVLANSQALERLCSKCGSNELVRHGHRINKSGSVQMMSCKRCGYTFSDRHIRGARAGNAALALVGLDLHFKGVSYADISNHLWQIYGVKKSGPTIFTWVKRFEALVAKALAHTRPPVGDKWIADEMFVSVNGKRMYAWDCIDARTRIVLATLLTSVRNAAMAEALIKKAIAKAGKAPKVLTTDHLPSYSMAVRRIPAKIKHVNKISITAPKNTNKIERYHSTVRRWQRPARGMKSERSDSFDGFSNYFNFVRPHSKRNGRAPAGRALEEDDGRWLTILNLQDTGPSIEAKA
jgi:transposase-like protein